MAEKGRLLKKDIAEDLIFEIGVDYDKSLNPAILANEKWVKSFEPIKKAIIELDGLYSNFKNIKTPKEFEVQKKKEIKLIDLSTIAINENKTALNNLNKTKEKNRQASNSTQQALIKERVALQVKNKIIREAKRDELGLVGAYQKLNKQRTEAKNKLADLLSAEKVNNKEVEKADAIYQKLNNKILKIDEATDNYTKNIGNYSSALGKNRIEQEKLANAFKLLNKQRTEAKTTLANLLSAEKVDAKQVKIAQKEYQVLNNRIKTINKTTNNYKNTINNTSKTTNKYVKNVRIYKKTLNGSNSNYKTINKCFGLNGRSVCSCIYF